MRSSTGDGRRTGWRALFDPDAWIRALLGTTIGVVSMALLACVIALARDTRSHDWYATGKLTPTELLIGIGFDDSAPTEYQTSTGEVLSLTRADLRYNGNALVARGHLLYTARKAAELGACCGFGGALLCLVLFRRPGGGHRTRRPAQEPASAQRPDPGERLASPQETVVSVPAPVGSRSAQSVPGVPVREPPDRPPESQVQRPTGSEPDGERRSEKGDGKTGARSTARRARRKVEWTRTDATEMVVTLSGWWNGNKHWLRHQTTMPFGSPADNAKRTAGKAVQALSAVFSHLPVEDEEEEIDSLREYSRESKGPRHPDEDVGSGNADHGGGGSGTGA